ncbi:MAG: hypothetical protein U0136_14345 [Bdellovibrionota bacterium]
MKLSSRFVGVAVALGIGLAPHSASASDAVAAVSAAIGGYHPSVTNEQLEQLAGGRESLVQALLEIRNDQTTPFVGVRAERLLLDYADRSDVQAALSADVDSPSSAGLARTVAIHLGRAPSADSQAALARKIVDRANREAEFVPFARTLKDSPEPRVQSVARSLKE